MQSRTKRTNISEPNQPEGGLVYETYLPAVRLLPAAAARGKGRTSCLTARLSLSEPPSPRST